MFTFSRKGCRRLIYVQACYEPKIVFHLLLKPERSEMHLNYCNPKAKHYLTMISVPNTPYTTIGYSFWIFFFRYRFQLICKTFGVYALFVGMTRTFLILDKEKWSYLILLHIPYTTLRYQKSIAIVKGS